MLSKKEIKKINAGVLYPADIVRKYNIGYSVTQLNDVLEEQWKALPDYIQGSDENSIAVVDVSWSMFGLPMDVSVSLGIYLAERAKGVYKDHMITFSQIPSIVKVTGDTLRDKLQKVYRLNWGHNTNIEAVFDVILQIAIKYQIPQDEMLDKLYVISDMEFDSAMGNSNIDETLMQTIANKYEVAGYKMPFLVFWNVNARNTQFPMSLDDWGFLNVSGYSPSIFTKLLNNDMIDPIELMQEVIEDDRYKQILA